MFQKRGLERGIQNKKDYGALGAGMMAVMYCSCLALYLAQKVLDHSRPVYLLLCAVLIVYECGMFFAAGLIVADRDREWRRDSLHFRNDMLFLSLFFLTLYVLLAIPARLLINGDDLYLAVRNIIAFVVIPKYCGIFLTLSLLFVIISAFYVRHGSFLKGGKLTAVVCLIGFLMSLIPAGTFGYALIGIFVGGDQYGAIPLASHLFVFYWGYRAARDDRLTFTNTRTLGLCGGSLAAGLVLFLLRLKAPGKLLIGASLSCLAACVLVVCIPLFEKILAMGLELLKMLGESVTGLEEAGPRGRYKRLFTYLALYVILFAGTAFLVFLTLIHRGQSLVWTGDALSQYIPKIHRFMRYIPGVFHDLMKGNPDILQYDLAAGMGSTMAISFDPIYWLYLFFSPSQIDTAYTIMSLLRYFLAGLSMSAMLLYFRRSYLSCFSASLAYAFSCYALYAGTRHFQFITPLILMPLMVVAMERLIRHNKWYMLTIMVTWSLLCSYYFLYMNTLALGVYFLCRIFFTKEYRNTKTFFTKGFTIVFSYVLGTMMGIISIVTSFGGYLSSSRSEGGKLSLLLSKNRMFYRPRWIEDTLLSSITYNFTPGYWLKIGTIPLALFGAVLLFSRKSRKDLRAIFVIFTAFCIFPFAGFIFGGFSGVTNRWSYIYTVLAGYLIAMCIDTMDRLKKSDIIALFVVTVYYALLVLFDENLMISSILGEMFFLALTLAIIFLANVKQFTLPSGAGKLLMLAVTVLALSFNGMMFLTQTKKNGKPLASFTRFNSYERLSKTSLRDLEKAPGYSNEDFFRCSALHGDVNTNCYSMLHDHYDVGTFSSTMNGSIVDYNRQMGNVDWSTVRVFDYNFRTYMNELASVRYLGTVSESFANLVPYGYKKVYETKEGFPLYENQYPLPLGYTYDSFMTESEAESLPVIERQEATMLTAITGDEDGPVISREIFSGKEAETKETLPLTSHEIPIKKISYDGIKQKDDQLIVEKDGGSLTIEFDSEPKSETYLVYQADIKKLDDGKSQTKKVKVSFDKTAYNYTFRTDAYKTGQTDHVLCLGYHKGKIHKVRMKFKTAGTITCQGLLLYSQPMKGYEDRVRKLSENVLEDVDISGNTVTGKISLDEGKILLITIPYQKGWTARVDGKEVPVRRVNYQYMGLALNEGSHTIKLHYQIPGWKAGLMITALGLALFIGIILLDIIRKKRSRAHR